MNRRLILSSTFSSLVVVLVAVPEARAAVLPASGLQAHYKADAGVVTVGPNVTQWNDQSALNGLNNATATGTNPTLGSAAIGYHASFPVVQFGTGTPLAFTLPAANTFAGVTILTVSSRIAPNNQYETVLATGGSLVSGGVRWGFGMGFDATYGYGWAGPTSVLSLGNGSSIANDTWHLISWAYDKTSWKVRNEYPTPLAVTTVADTSFFTGNWNGVIGAEDSVGSYHFSGQIAELLIYDHQLSPAEYQQALLYLQERFFVAPVPEPSTLALLGLGMVGLVVKARRRRAAA